MNHPALKEFNTKALKSPYQRRKSSLGSSDDGKNQSAAYKAQANAAGINIGSPAIHSIFDKPVHQKAQLQQNYDRMKRFMRERRSIDTGVKVFPLEKEAGDDYTRNFDHAQTHLQVRVPEISI